MRLRSYLALIAAVLVLQVPVGGAGQRLPAHYVGTYIWHEPGTWFGGFSGLELSDDGLRFVSQSDRGHYVTGTLTRDAEGRVTGVKNGPIEPILGPTGAPLPTWMADSEGLAITPSGQMYISFEGVQRVLEYDRIGAPAHEIPRDPDFPEMVYNGSLEALAVDASGALYTLPEVGQIGAPIQVYRYANRQWTHPFTLPRPDKFRPVGADFGPDGKLYLLERRFSGIFGFSSRVIRLTLGPDHRPIRTETLLQTSPGTHDNLEGLAVWQDAQGRIRLTMVSDDNFNFFQRTELVDYVIMPGKKAAKAAPRS